MKVNVAEISPVRYEASVEEDAQIVRAYGATAVSARNELILLLEVMLDAAEWPPKEAE